MAALDCPQCHGDAPQRVIDSRPRYQGDGIARLRVCDGCGHRFVTLEQAIDARPRLFYAVVRGVYHIAQ